MVQRTQCKSWKWTYFDYGGRQGIPEDQIEELMQPFVRGKEQFKVVV